MIYFAVMIVYTVKECPLRKAFTLPCLPATVYLGVSAAEMLLKDNFISSSPPFFFLPLLKILFVYVIDSAMVLNPPERAEEGGSEPGTLISKPCFYSLQVAMPMAGKQISFSGSD